MTESRVHEDEDVSLLWILAVLVRERRAIIAFVLAGMVASVSLALLRHRTYSTSFSFVLQSPQDQSGAGLASLVGQFGISLGTPGGLSRSPQFHADLLLTREILGPIAGDSFALDRERDPRVPLPQALRITGTDPAVVLDRTVRRLRTGVISTMVTRATSVITANVRTQHAELSREIAQRLLEGLNHFNLVTRQSQARAEREFLEGRSAAIRVELDSVQGAQRRFLEKNRVYQTDPRLALEMEQLNRDVQLRASVYQTISESYEKARIDEVRNTPVITVIERPAVAVRPDSRQTLLFLMLGTLAAFAVAAPVVLLRDAWTRDRTIGRDPALNLLSHEWKRIRGVAP